MGSHYTPLFSNKLFCHKKISKNHFYREKNLVDNLLRRLENYSQHLEDKVEERTILYKGEKERADTLLYQMLPKRVAEQLKKGDVSKKCPVVLFFFCFRD